MTGRQCRHEARRGTRTRGVCIHCDREIVSNGCGPGWIPMDEVNETTGWRICDDGEARWFGTPDRQGARA